MKVKNNSTFPKIISGTRIESGEIENVDDVSKDDLTKRLEAVEQSGDSGSDQNTKTDTKSESETQESNQGGE